MSCYALLGDLPHPGIKLHLLCLCALAGGFLTTVHLEASCIYWVCKGISNSNLVPKVIFPDLETSNRAGYFLHAVLGTQSDVTYKYFVGKEKKQRLAD